MRLNITEEAINKAPLELASCRFRGIVGELVNPREYCVYLGPLFDLVLGIVFWWILVLFVWFILNKQTK